MLFMYIMKTVNHPANPSVCPCARAAATKRSGTGTKPAAEDDSGPGAWAAATATINAVSVAAAAPRALRFRQCIPHAFLCAKLFFWCSHETAIAAATPS